jgi:hypothetical protein
MRHFHHPGGRSSSVDSDGDSKQEPPNYESCFFDRGGLNSYSNYCNEGGGSNTSLATPTIAKLTGEQTANHRSSIDDSDI